MDGYDIVEACSRACQYIPRPPLPGIYVPKEVILKCVSRTPHNDTGRIQCRPLPVWNLGDLLVPPASGTNTEWLP